VSERRCEQLIGTMQASPDGLGLDPTFEDEEGQSRPSAAPPARWLLVMATHTMEVRREVASPLLAKALLTLAAFGMCSGRRVPTHRTAPCALLTRISAANRLRLPRSPSA
jgi:hypothetical protein